ncbi:hypothetical protein COO91_11105 (plasmid) [Nostoc flagelliforme CCNUN1]|uniref:Uncharacterized protein n=1 Tax=Nostoc flagelliforme CCNUN1 TaxID=2038116 RepID=A0A2K8TAY2_9NOSO|nr:hypothetical protein COO91_11105 [Nostoc flagelliforme CCNUN1]
MGWLTRLQSAKIDYKKTTKERQKQIKFHRWNDNAHFTQSLISNV